MFLFLFVAFSAIYPIWRIIKYFKYINKCLREKLENGKYVYSNHEEIKKTRQWLSSKLGDKADKYNI